MPVNQYQESFWIRTKHSLFFNMFFLFIAAGLLWGLINIIRQAIYFKDQSEVLNQRVAELTQKKQELEAQIAELGTTQVQEREAKGRLNVKKPGEEVVVVVPEQKKQERVAAPTPAAPSFWKRVEMFFNELFGQPYLGK